jgi:endogenous inhibitor of DNA gyrase (YacG/DUF329 family)
MPIMKVRCPICAKKMDGQGPKEWPDWPFCSPRCKLIDLGRWLGEEYRLGTAEALDQEALEQPDPKTGPPTSAVPSAVRNREEA